MCTLDKSMFNRVIAILSIRDVDLDLRSKMLPQGARVIDILSLWLFWLKSENIGPDIAPIVGEYKSIIDVSTSGKKYAAFEGIPYAMPPLRNLSFSNPVATDRKTNLMRRVDCLHFDLQKEKLVGEEDCLYLNVYTHVPLEDNASKSVMIWIHGSVFTQEQVRGSLFGPQRLMDVDIIVITISYRAGPIGFASLEDPSFPGNYGFMDQKMAIKWVLDNIHLFGGDRNKLTLAGHGAGAADVLHHLHSDMPVRLAKGIALSGTRFSPWHTSTLGTVKKNTMNLLEKLSCSVKDKMACLRNLDGQKIVLAAKDLSDMNLYGTENIHHVQSYRPSVDNFFMPYRTVVDGKNVLDPWEKNSTKNNFYLLVGLASQEASFIFKNVQEKIRSKLAEGKKVIFKKFYQNFISAMKPAKKMNANFTKGYENWAERYDGLLNIFNDVWFLYPALLEARSHLGMLEAFLFNYENGCGQEKPGVSHGDILPMIFKINSCDRDNPMFNYISERVAKMLGRFVEYSNPDVGQFTAGPHLINIRDSLQNTNEFANLDRGIVERLSYWKTINPAEIVEVE